MMMMMMIIGSPSERILSETGELYPILRCTARCKARGGNYAMKSAEFLSECGYAKCFFSQSSKPNELIFNTMFYESVCLKDPHR